jgi:D-alanyl-D-alanine dipeptidase
LAYVGPENFVGRIIDGYSENADDVCLLSTQAASALCDVQNELNQSHLGLYIFDAYRPLRAVKDFARWYHAPVENEYERVRQQVHYPHLFKYHRH